MVVVMNVDGMIVWKVSERLSEVGLDVTDFGSHGSYLGDSVFSNDWS